MRLIRAHVYNFGGLSNFRYDFTEGLNTFLQDNGWGKTTFATFLKVMFYGFLKNEINDCAIDEKKKYIPWQEGTFGGEIDFSTENKKYRIKRIFSKDENDNNDEITVLDLNEGKEVQKFGENIGESLFSLDVNAFQRSIFIGRNGISIEKASQSLNDRLKNMVNQINDLFMYDITIDKLNKKLNEYVKEDKTGAIDNINNKIELKKEILEVVENEIKNIDEAKKRMIELDSILADTSNELESKKDLYENLIVRFENNEAVKKQISSVYSKKSNLDIEMNFGKCLSNQNHY